MDRLQLELVERSCRRWEAEQMVSGREQDIPQRSPRDFSIALSREFGTLATSIAREVGTMLGWPVYDHELLEGIAREMGLRINLLESVDERQQPWLKETIQAALASLASGDTAPWASESSFVHHLVETVLALGAHGQCVIVGRGAAFILPAENTLRVQLVAPLHERIATISRKFNISEREAAHRIRTVDRQRRDFVHDHFRKDPTDPHGFDMILNTSRLSVSQCAELIIEALSRLKQEVRANSTQRSLP